MPSRTISFYFKPSNGLNAAKRKAPLDDCAEAGQQQSPPVAPRKRLRKHVTSSNENDGNLPNVEDVLDECLPPIPQVPVPSDSLDHHACNLPKNDKAGDPKATKFTQSCVKTPQSKKKKKTAANGRKRKQYCPVKNATWKPEQRVPYLFLAKAFDAISKISGRLEIIEILCNVFRSIIALTPEDLLPAVYLCSNKLGPAYEGLELGIGESILMKAVAHATGASMSAVKTKYEKLGDLGLVAQQSRSTQGTMFAPAHLTIAGVFRDLKAIAKEQGKSSQTRKKKMIERLFVGCRDVEPQYIIRSLQGKLRIGLAEKTVLLALADAFVLTLPKRGDAPLVLNTSNTMSRDTLQDRFAFAQEMVKGVYSQQPNYDKLVPALLTHNIGDLLEHCHLTPGTPVVPMLAQPTRGVSEVLDRLSGRCFTCEWKYDGERAQIHKLADGSIHIYSRNLECNTTKYPDILAYLPKAVKNPIATSSFIIDCEVVAYDKETQEIKPFQLLSTRARKTVALDDVKVPVCLYAFDIIYLNGDSLLKVPLGRRRTLLHETFRQVPGEFRFAKYKDTKDSEDIQVFLEESIKGNCEGLMVKTLEDDATYEPSRRSYNWLKVKKDYLEGMADSLDLVVIGAYNGKGKRVGGYGGFLLACYDDESEEFQSICKVGTGFSDTDLAHWTKILKDKEIPQPKPYYRVEGSKADVWFDASIVWEVTAADFSLSPLYEASKGLVSASKGISLRFPRYIRNRNDKEAEDATTAAQVAELYNKQNLKM